MVSPHGFHGTFVLGAHWLSWCPPRVTRAPHLPARASDTATGFRSNVEMEAADLPSLNPSVAPGQRLRPSSSRRPPPCNLHVSFPSLGQNAGGKLGLEGGGHVTQQVKVTVPLGPPFNLQTGRGRRELASKVAIGDKDGGGGTRSSGAILGYSESLRLTCAT